MKRYWLFGLLAALFISCAGSLTGEISASPELKAKPPKTYAMLPFEMRLSPELSTISIKDALKYPNAPANMSDAFETAFLEAGLRLVERTRLEAAIKELAFANSGFTTDDGVKLGKLVSADAILIGTITAYHQGGFGKKPTIVSVSVKTIDVESGTILWKGQATFKGPPIGKDFGADPSQVAARVAKKLLQELVAQKP